jgi:hypothetical protein
MASQVNHSVLWSATWAEDRSWGYHTPIHKLNCIIRLQTVVEIITNETSRALNLLAKQSTKMCNAIYQNHLALNYLLASEGGICGKFNLSNCCLQIDYEGKVIEEITDRMRKTVHVSIQTWRGWNSSDLFGRWFSALGGFKTLIAVMTLVLGVCLLPCLVPLMLQSTRTIMEATIEGKPTTHIMMLWKYKPLNQDDVL